MLGEPVNPMKYAAPTQKSTLSLQGAQQDATDVTEAFYRASMSWARQLAKLSFMSAIPQAVHQVATALALRN